LFGPWCPPLNAAAQQIGKVKLVETVTLGGQLICWPLTIAVSMAEE
jgi:hypothetical protein